MLAAFGWGFLAAATLIAGGAFVLRWRVGERTLGMIMAFGSVSGLAALVGFGVFDSASANVNAFVLAFAAGAILTMLADTMMPEAFEHGGKLVGVVTTFGFALAFAISSLE